jgi:hypothetical protein
MPLVPLSDCPPVTDKQMLLCQVLQEAFSYGPFGIRSTSLPTNYAFARPSRELITHGWEWLIWYINRLNPTFPRWTNTTYGDIPRSASQKQRALLQCYLDWGEDAENLTSLSTDLANLFYSGDSSRRRFAITNAILIHPNFHEALLARMYSIAQIDRNYLNEIWRRFKAR